MFQRESLGPKEKGWVQFWLEPLEMLPWVEGCGGPCSSTVKPPLPCFPVSSVTPRMIW